MPGWPFACSYPRTEAPMGLFLRRIWRTGLLAATLLSATTTPAAAQTLADQALQDRVTDALNTKMVPRIYDLHVAVVDGLTTLTGMVATADQRAEVEALAKRAGASSIVNAVVVNR